MERAIVQFLKKRNITCRWCRNPKSLTTSAHHLLSNFASIAYHSLCDIRQANKLSELHMSHLKWDLKVCFFSVSPTDLLWGLNEIIQTSNTLRQRVQNFCSYNIRLNYYSSLSLLFLLTNCMYHFFPLPVVHFPATTSTEASVLIPRSLKFCDKSMKPSRAEMLLSSFLV